jgi:catechol 2,3-dioxygenase-like lactoylglutathione lyase family enzyme
MEVKMSRIHISVKVRDLNDSKAFYSSLFGAPPTVQRSDYAKWMLEDPRVNFSISLNCGRTEGLGHLGVQVDNDLDLKERRARMAAAGDAPADQNDVPCCYGRQDKTWVTDPQGIAWEVFHTLEPASEAAEETSADTLSAASGGCCRPSVDSTRTCC